MDEKLKMEKDSSPMWTLLIIIKDDDNENRKSEFPLKCSNSLTRSLALLTYLLLTTTETVGELDLAENCSHDSCISTKISFVRFSGKVLNSLRKWRTRWLSLAVMTENANVPSGKEISQNRISFSKSNGK